MDNETINIVEEFLSYKFPHFGKYSEITVKWQSWLVDMKKRTTMTSCWRRTSSIIQLCTGVKK